MEKEMKIEAPVEGAACEGACGCKENQKANYEQLANIANQLYVQNQEMGKRLTELEMNNFFKRLEWLWQIVNSNTAYISEEFKRTCGAEFMSMMVSAEDQPQGESSPVEE